MIAAAADVAIADRFKQDLAAAGSILVRTVYTHKLYKGTKSQSSRRNSLV